MKQYLTLAALTGLYLALAAFAAWLGIHFTIYLQSKP